MATTTDRTSNGPPSNGRPHNGRPSNGHGHQAGSARAAFSYPDFRRMWVAAFSSSIGTWMQNVVLPLYVLDRTNDATAVAAVGFAQLGPLLFLSIPAGVIADRFDRRKWLIAMQLVQLTFSALLAPLTIIDAPIWSILLVTLGVGVGNALNAPAWSAMLPTMVSKPDLSGAVSLQSVMINGSRVLGPIVVALLRSAGASIAEIVLINAFTYLFVVVALLRTHVSSSVHAAATAGWRQLTVGIGIARRNAAIGRILLALFSFSLVSLPYVGLFAIVARQNFGIDKGSTSYEWLFAIWAFGACMGGLAIGTIFVKWDKRRLIRQGFLAFALSLAGFALARNVSQALISGALLGFAYFGTTTAMSTVMQNRISDHERGRVMALWFMAFGGTVPLGYFAFAPLIDAIGARWVLLIGAAWALLLAWWCNIAAIDRLVDKGRGQLLETDHTASFDQHGMPAGQ